MIIVVYVSPWSQITVKTIFINTVIFLLVKKVKSIKFSKRVWGLSVSVIYMYVLPSRGPRVRQVLR